MDPAALWRPVGPEPSRVYWTRRLVLLVAVLVVVLLLAWSCGGGEAAPRSGRTGGDPVTTHSPKPDKQSAPRCGDDQLLVTADTDAEVYPAGVLPQLTVSVHNTDVSPCRLAVQDSSRTWSVFSGTDQVWTTADCPADDSVRLRRLGADRTLTYHLQWDRHRSIQGCASPGTESGPGTYRLYVNVAGVRSAAAVFHLTD